METISENETSSWCNSCNSSTEVLYETEQAKSKPQPLDLWLAELDGKGISLVSAAVTQHTGLLLVC